MVDSASGWNAGCAGKTLLSLDNAFYTWAPQRRLEAPYKSTTFTQWCIFLEGVSDVNKDWTCKDNKDQAYKDQDKDKD